MMETDGRDCATCQNPSKGDMDGIIEFLNDNRTRLCIVIFFPFEPKETCKREKMQWLSFDFFILERECATSL